MEIVTGLWATKRESFSVSHVFLQCQDGPKPYGTRTCTHISRVFWLLYDVSQSILLSQWLFHSFTAKLHQQAGCILQDAAAQQSELSSRTGAMQIQVWISLLAQVPFFSQFLRITPSKCLTCLEERPEIETCKWVRKKLEYVKQLQSNYASFCELLGY